jgi:uncharacterized protein (TIGR02145 family)
MKPTVLTFGGVRLTASNGKALFRHGTTTIGGRTYKTVLIGSQEWLAENLQLDDGGDGIATKSDDPYEGYVYYTWDAAVRVAATAPDGWHLPSQTEWDDIASAVGGTSVAGTKLKSTTGWSSGNGDDSYGFAAFPAGCRLSGSFDNLGSLAYFWTANEYSSSIAYFRYFYTGASMNSNNLSKTFAYSVRLVRNA